MLEGDKYHGKETEQGSECVGDETGTEAAV